MDSALVRAIDPDAWISGQVHLLREIEQGIRTLAWQNTKDATSRHPRQYPERLPLTVAEVDAERAKHAPEYDAVPIEDMAVFLGWSRPTPKEA